jgi:hypothetical protein
MAKAKTAPNASANDTAASNPLTDNLELVYGDWKTDAQALGWPVGTPISKAIAYVIANGFKQSMTDASAMTKEQKAKAHEEAVKANPGVEITLEQAVEAKAHEQRTKRFADILAGNVGVGGGGPKLPQIERVMREIAEEQIRAAVVANNAKVGQQKPDGKPYVEFPMPKGENLKTLIEKRLVVGGDAIRTAAQARIDAAKSAVDDLGIDLS